MFEEVKKLNKSVAIWLAIISLLSVGIVVGVLFITVSQPKHSQFCAKCHNNISFNNACKKSLSEDIACIECHTHENKGMTVIATEIRDDHCTNDSCHPLTKLSARPVHYKGLKPFQHKTHLAINLNQITSLSPDQEEVKKSPDGKVFTREDTKDKFIVIVQHPHLTSPLPLYPPHGVGHGEGMSPRWRGRRGWKYPPHPAGGVGGGG